MRSRSTVDRLRRYLSSASRSRHPARSVWRRIYWRLHWRLCPRRPFVVPFARGLRMRLGPTSASCGVYFNEGLSAESIARWFQALLRPGMVVVDCGAHIGEYTLLCAERVGLTGHVHAFEPDARTFWFLEQNVRLNSLTNVSLNRMAVGCQNGEVAFVLRDDPAASSLVTAGEATGASPRVIVPQVTLDEYVHLHDLQKIDVLKIDVEGAEVQVLEGARQLLAQLRPLAIFIECEAPNSAATLRQQLEDRRYEVSVECAGRSCPHLFALSKDSAHADGFHKGDPIA